MSNQEINEDKVCLPHHIQQPLCSTRLPYRQGRKLTAVKVYTVTTESNHLLIFGVPSLNLRHETKSLFAKFGKLLQFNISKNHEAETFTDTYHACFEKIQSARVAKRMLDNKNFYGGSLHVCYAPEFENLDETRNKLIKRNNDVMHRLRILKKEDAEIIKEKINDAPNVITVNKLNMGEVNEIKYENSNVDYKKRKKQNDHNIVMSKPSTVSFKHNSKTAKNPKAKKIKLNDTKDKNDVEIVDCTSVDKETITNINDSLNYDKFGSELVVKVPLKAVNRIKFNIGSKTTN